ncbi:PAS domain-containing protein [Marinobacter sp.]|uniref:PAS domain-containing protein n=1 Tax=Marinobacter sp. TaxID=50741 RepID=UPI0035640974
MRITNNLSRQVALYLIVTSSLSVALLTLLLMLLPNYPVSQVWKLSPGGAIGVAMASATLGAVLLGDRLGRLILPALLAIYGAASALFQLLSPAWQQGVPGEPYLLAVVPALIMILLAFCCWYGNKRRSGRLLWRTGGTLGVAFGVGALAGASDIGAGGALETLRGQATHLGSFAAIGLGCAFWLASTGQGGTDKLRLSRSVMVLGLCAIVVTFFLAYQATHAQEQSRRSLATQWLDGYAGSLKGALDDRALMLERLVDSWARLDDRMGNDDLVRDSRILFSDHPGFRALLKINKRARENWRFSDDPDLTLWLENQLLKDDGLRWVRLFPERSETSSWLVPDNRHPERLLVITRPADSSQQYLVALLDLQVLIQQELPADHGGLGVRLAGPKGELAVSGLPASSGRIALATRSFSLGDNAGVLTLAATGEPGRMGLLPTAILVFGLLLAFVAMHARALMEEQQQRAGKLAAEGQRLRALIDRNPDPVFVIDREHRFQRMNAATAEILGMGANRLAGMDFRELINETTVPADDLGMLEHAYNQALSGLTPSGVRLTFQNFGKEPRRFSLLFVPVVVGGDVEGVFGLARELPA